MNKINIYTCKTGHKTITKDTEPREVTPIFIKCPICKEQAGSSFYMVDQNIEPEYEWFIPSTIKEYREAIIPTYGDVCSDKQLQEMINNRSGCKVFYRKINKP